AVNIFLFLLLRNPLIPPLASSQGSFGISALPKDRGKLLHTSSTVNGYLPSSAKRVEALSSLILPST
ncbi:MAG: hypothetical protein P4L42_14160, partial [Desulfocapsaceae bacterium]|nr:hypothetical protein [Desulfocapsaceae bacterium]